MFWWCSRLWSRESGEIAWNVIFERWETGFDVPFRSKTYKHKRFEEIFNNWKTYDCFILAQPHFHFFLFPLVNLQRTISQSQICGQIRHCSLFKRVFSSWFQPWVLRWGSAHEAWHRKNVKIWAPVALSRIAIIIVRNDRSIETVSCTRVDFFPDMLPY